MKVCFVLIGKWNRIWYDRCLSRKMACFQIKETNFPGKLIGSELGCNVVENVLENFQNQIISHFSIP